MLNDKVPPQVEQEFEEQLDDYSDNLQDELSDFFTDKAKDQTGGKITKAQAGFEHPAQGPDHCEACVNYETDGDKTCKLVIGNDIEEGDWCKLFTKG